MILSERCSQDLAERVESGPTATADRLDYVLAACVGKRVLHVGCADYPDTEQKLARGTLLHARLRDVARSLHGIDLSERGIRTLREAGFDDLAVCDVEDLGSGRPFFGVDFDLVLAGEVIEHLSNPGMFLDGLKGYLHDEARLLITTVNAYCAHRFVYALLRDRESLNPEHTMYFSRRTLAQLGAKHGYVLEDLRFYPAREYEHHLNRGRYRVLWWTDRLAIRFRPMLAEGLIARFRLERGQRDRLSRT